MTNVTADQANAIGRGKLPDHLGVEFVRLAPGEARARMEIALHHSGAQRIPPCGERHRARGFRMRLWLYDVVARGRDGLHDH